MYRIQKVNLLKLFVWVFFLLSGGLAVADANGEYKDMTKFDIQAFNQHKKGDNWYQTFADGTTIRQTTLPSTGYLVVITNNTNPYSESRVFNFQGELIGTTRFFHGFPIGTTINYDGKGNIISKEEHDLPFLFSLDDVAKKMRAEYKVDIINRQEVPIVKRAVDQINLHIPFYIVYLHDPKNHQLIAYLIHGATGEMLFTRETDIEGNTTLVLRSYAETLKQKKPN